jgi:hypothetical protein
MFSRKNYKLLPNLWNYFFTKESVTIYNRKKKVEFYQFIIVISTGNDKSFSVKVNI